MNDQAAKLRAQFEAKHRGRTIAVASGKGGVGKSNFSLNLSVALTQQEQRVLLIDLDIGMGNLEILLGASADRTLVDMLEGFFPFEEVIEKTEFGLTYIAGGSGLQELFHMESAKFEHFLKEFDRIQTLFDYILFDMGAGLSNESAAFILAADETIVVTTTEPTAIMDAYSLIKHITAKDADMPISLLVNRAFDRREGQDTKERLSSAAKKFLNKEVNTIGILPEDRQFPAAVKAQSPLLIKAPKAKAAFAIQQIAAAFTKQMPPKPAESKTPFMARLRQYLRKVEG